MTTPTTSQLRENDQKQPERGSDSVERLVGLDGCARWLLRPAKPLVKGRVVCGIPFILRGRSGALYECEPTTWIYDHKVILPNIEMMDRHHQQPLPKKETL
ncbi:MAG: hypothetical protein IT576_02090 [Verrucomicrobiales bacterium]|nr:hypothetical protein [Verrucomicrobiales bacterium]